MVARGLSMAASAQRELSFGLNGAVRANHGKSPVAALGEIARALALHHVLKARSVATNWHQREDEASPHGRGASFGSSVRKALRHGKDAVEPPYRVGGEPSTHLAQWRQRQKPTRLRGTHGGGRLQQAWHSHRLSLRAACDQQKKHGSACDRQHQAVQ